MDLGRIERDVRRIPGVLACQLSAGELTVLVAPDGDPAAVAAAVDRLFVGVAGSPVVSVIGGRDAAAPPRLARRGVLAVSAAGAALVTAAGVAAGLSGVLLGDDDRPSIGSAAAPGPPATLPSDDVETAPPVSADATGRTASPPALGPFSADGTRSVQPPAQLAALGGVPTLLTFELPVPGRPPARPRVERAAPAPASPPSTGASAAAPEPEPTTTTAPTTTTTTTTTTPPPEPPASPAPADAPATGDTHDNDRGERAEDSNGHDEKGPQRDSGGRGF